MILHNETRFKEEKTKKNMLHNIPPRLVDTGDLDVLCNFQVKALGEAANGT